MLDVATFPPEPTPGTDRTQRALRAHPPLDRDRSAELRARIRSWMRDGARDALDEDTPGPRP